MSQPRVVEPYLLTAVCHFCYSLMTSKEVLQRRKFFKEISSKMFDLENLMPYLGGKKYPTLCEMANCYQKGSIIRKQAVNLSQLKNNVCLDLFISIIKLVAFYSIHQLP